MNNTQALILLAATMLITGSYADTFGAGANQFSIDFINIGNADNVADSTGYGAVDYNYRIGKFEVTASQWASVLAVDSNVGNAGDWAGSQPTAGTSWFEGAKFANWLTTGDAYNGAYQFDGSGALMAVDRDAAVSVYGTVYVLPSEDEWYKAAYLKSDGSAYTLYATGDSVPTAGAGGANYNQVNGSAWDVGTGIAENNGTYDMAGNVWEWMESAYDGNLDSMGENRVLRGNAYEGPEVFLRPSERGPQVPAAEGDYKTGFRVAAIPEPSSIAMIGLVSGCAVFVRRTFVV